MKPSLAILAGERAGERLILEDGKRYILGRDQTADICLPEKRISRRHACIYWERTSNRVIVEDLGSLNGTSVNGFAVSGAKILENGDRIQLGSHVLQLQFPEMSFLQEAEGQTDKKYKSRPSHVSEGRPQENVLEDLEPLSDSLSREFTGGRMIHGRLAEIGLADLLQMLAATKKSGQLILSERKLSRAPSPSRAAEGMTFIYLKEGEVEHAFDAENIGEDAFFDALKKNKGHFAVFPFDAESSYDVTITTPLEALLLEGFRRMDEEKASRTKLSPHDIFEVKPDEPLGTLDSNELAVFQAVWKHKKFSNILERSPLSKDETTEVLKKLLRGGFVVKVKPQK